MYFAFVCRDKPNGQDLRGQNRQAHLEYLERFEELLLAAGPLQNEEGTGMTGSLLILDLPDRRAAEDFAANDPYARAGLFESVEIHRWKKVFPAGV
jgi:uncharacterized protein YciI